MIICMAFNKRLKIIMLKIYKPRYSENRETIVFELVLDFAYTVNQTHTSYFWTNKPVNLPTFFLLTLWPKLGIHNSRYCTLNFHFL